MFGQKMFWCKKCFANNNDDSRINEMLCIVKLEQWELLKGLDFTFHAV